MNLPGYDWKSNFLKPSCHHPDITTKLTNTVLLKWFQSSHGVKMLSIFFFITNNESRIQKLKIIPGISEYDGIVYIETDISPITYKQKPRKIYLYKRAD